MYIFLYRYLIVSLRHLLHYVNPCYSCDKTKEKATIFFF